MQTRITIITATYNSVKTLEQTIKSLHSQTYKNVQHIIIDGKSSDGTLEIIDKYKQHIDIVISEADKGIYDALNKGIALATSEVIGFLHADDIFAADNVLEEIANVFYNNNIDAVYGDLQYVAETDINKIIRHWRSNSFEPNKIYKGWMPPHPTFYVRRQMYLKHNTFNINYKIAADYDMMMRLLFVHKIKVKYIPMVMIKMRVGGKSNASIKNIIRKMSEDYNIMRTHKIGGILTLFFKNISKISQF